MRITAICLVALALPAFAQYNYFSVDTYSGNGTPGHVDGPLDSSLFNYPYGVCSDVINDVVYIADRLNNCIRRSQYGMVTTVAGSGVQGDLDGIGTAAQFYSPTGVYYKDGNLYICDDLNNKIKRMDPLGNVVTIAGSGGQGFQDGPALQAEFYQPKSVVVDDFGVIYVADYENHRIRKIENGVVSTIAGNGSAGDVLGPALSASLHRPRDLCLDDDGNIYFVDLMNHKVKVLTANGDVELVAGSGVPGSADGVGASAQFSTPVGIDWFSPGTLLVLDAVNPRLRTVTVGGLVTTIAGSGNTGYVDGPLFTASFDLPQDVCMGHAGTIFIGDRNNNAIRVLDPFFTLDVTKPAELPSNPIEASLFPNPASDHVRIYLGAGRDNITALEVFDGAGRQVMAVDRVVGVATKEAPLTIPVADLAPGRYTVVVRTRDTTFSSSFVKEEAR